MYSCSNVIMVTFDEITSEDSVLLSLAHTISSRGAVYSSEYLLYLYISMYIYNIVT